MNKTRIEWVRNPDGSPGYTVNPVKGLCPVGCEYCYARRMYKRFGWDPRIRYEAWGDSLAHINQPSRIFVGSTMELFGDWIYPQYEYTWLEAIFSIVRSNPCHTFLFLTKRPEALSQWSPFPDNCWVGVTATDSTSFSKATDGLMYVKAAVKFISIEPLLAPVRFYPERLPYCGIDWIIIGQQTPVRKATMPKVEWIREIVEAADQAPITPVFLKDNLKPLLVEYEDGIEYAPLWANGGHGTLRQELP